MLREIAPARHDMTDTPINSEAIAKTDLDLGIHGFQYSDLFDAVRLKDLTDKFYAEVSEKEPVIGDALAKYIAAGGVGYERKVESKILTDGAPFL